ncbi:MAG: hypothetical protein WC277_09870 [Bacilli bacterium]
MELYIRKETGTVDPPVFQKILEDIPGGVTLATDNLPSDLKYLKAGTPLVESTSTSGIYRVCKRGLSNSTQTSTTLLLLKPGHPFKVGDFINKELSGAASVSTILAITHTSATTDSVLVGAAMILATNTVIYQTSAANATTYTGSPTALLRDTVVIHDGTKTVTTCYNVSAGAVVRGTVNQTAVQSIGHTGYTAKDKSTNLTTRFRFV